MFYRARATGLPMLGGYDVYAKYRDTKVRAHYWRADDKVHEPQQKNQSGKRSQTRLNAKGTIFILPGFTEFCEKYSLEALRFHETGYHVLLIDWPGQGKSGHFGTHSLMVHCDDFDHHLGAIDAVIKKTGLEDSKLILFGHSMGGHLALRYSALRFKKVRAVILTAPMMAPPVTPIWLVRAVSFILSKIGFARSYPPFHRLTSLDSIRNYQADNALTRDPKRYEDQFTWFDDAPELRRSGPSVGWVNAAYRSCALYTLNSQWLANLEVPVLAFVAGDERVVLARATDNYLPHVKNLQLIDFIGARHELTRELPYVTERLWRHVDSFLKQLSH